MTSMLDVAFPVDGTTVPADHRSALAEALEGALPWLAGFPGAGVHRLNVSAGSGAQALLSKRTRLVLRLPRERLADAAHLAGAELRIGAQALRLGAGQARELQPHSTLYAHLVAAADDADELAFLQRMEDELATLGVPCRLICGRAQRVEQGRLHGFSLMLDGLAPASALRVLHSGLGPHRRLGCGLFVPHRSAAAVGS